LNQKNRKTIIFEEQKINSFSDLYIASKEFQMIKLIKSLFEILKANKKLLLCYLVPLGFFLAATERSYYNAFIEADFLHFPFLIDFVEKRSISKFITIFGEHIIPGYNIILLINYYCCDLNVRLENLLFIIATVITGIIISAQANLLYNKNNRIAALIAFIVVILPTHEQMWGMALAAVLGVSLWTYIALLISREKIGLATYCLIFVATFILDGAYSVGGLAATLLFCIFERNSAKKEKLYLAIYTILLGFLYFSIIRNNINYSSTNVNGINHSFKSIFDALKFVAVLTSSPTIGNPFFDLHQLFIPYEIFGSLAFCLSAYLFYKNIKFKGYSFFEMLYVYSLVNILVVTFARSRFGSGHALGNWYIAHTQFINVYLIVHISLLLKNNAFLIKAALFAWLSISLYGLSLVWKKSFYVAGWKKNFVEQSNSIVNDPNYIKQSKSVFDTMIWDGETVKQSLEFMRRNKKWIFK
jgi:hypothetical protein